jgi:hypothetical protein
MYKLPIYIYYSWFIWLEWISQSIITWKAKSEMWDAIRSPMWPFNDSMFIEELVVSRQWRNYNVVLENSDIILISCQ